MTGAYYNEIEPYPSQWMRNLIDGGHIASGVVDERSIVDVQPEDIGDGQAHFFAGVGVWSYALRLAGVPDEASIWTGSCPCQPFSTAGNGRGADDERHLWPEFFRLISQRRPAIVFGEQVASSDGRAWLAAVRADLETLGYAVGASDLCAAGAGSDHARQRLFWVAYAVRTGRTEGWPISGGGQASGRSGSGGGLGDADRIDSGRNGGAGARAKAAGSGEGRSDRRLSDLAGAPDRDGGRMGDAYHARPQGHGGSLAVNDPEGRHAAERHNPSPGFQLPPVERWWVECDDPVRGRLIRPAEPGTFPLAHGAASRVGRLRAYGNAINARVAAAFIRAALDAIMEVGRD